MGEKEIDEEKEGDGVREGEGVAEGVVDGTQGLLQPGTVAAAKRSLTQRAAAVVRGHLQVPAHTNQSIMGMGEGLAVAVWVAVGTAGGLTTTGDTCGEGLGGSI